MQPDLPPPYHLPTPPTNNNNDDDDDTLSATSTEPDMPTSSISLHCAKTIRGSNNLLGSNIQNDFIPVNLLKQILDFQKQANQTGRVQLNVTINCSTTVIGDRNVIAGGAVGVRPNVPANGNGNGNGNGNKVEGQVVAGAKRKRDDGEVECEGEKEKKTVKVEEE